MLKTNRTSEEYVSTPPLVFNLVPAFLCLPSPAVAQKPRSPAREADSVWRHGVLLVHHPAGHHLGLALPAGRCGPPAL